MKLFRPMPAFNGVAAGAVATLNLPIGNTYHGILLTRGGTFTHDHMTDITLKANGRAILEMSGSDLDDFNLFDGLAAAGASLSYIPFERMGLLNKEWVEATAIGTGVRGNKDLPLQIQTLTLEITISGSAVTPTLSAKALQSAPAPVGAIIKRRKFTFSAAGAGTVEIADLPRGDLINRIAIHAASDNVTGVTLERDNFELFNRTPAENNLIQTDGIKVPQSNWFVLDPTEKGNGNEAVITADSNDFRLGVTTSGADTLTVYVEYLGGLTGN